MSFFAPKPSLPPVQPAPAPVTREDPAVQEARRDAQRRAAGLQRGRRATLLTGGAGVTTPATTARATLLGG